MEGARPIDLIKKMLLIVNIISVAISMDKEMIEYLKQDDIGKVIAKGLANLYTTQPDKPVKYLIQWLKNYSETQKELQKIRAQESVKY